MATNLDEVIYVDPDGVEHTANVSRVHSKNLVDLIYEANGLVQADSGVPKYMNGMTGGFYKTKEGDT